MSAEASPNAVIKSSPMSWYQYAIIAVCVLTYAADGLDVVTLSYAAPAMIKEWGISPQAFGLAYSVTPIGIAIGSVFVSPLADKIGRRTLILWLLAFLVVLLGATALTPSIAALVGLRLLTGICLGALVVSLNVTVSEFSNERRSGVLIGILHMGYSFGSMLCGGLAAILIEPYGWRSIFVAAAVLNLLSFLLALAILAEAPSYLTGRRPAGALERLNSLFRKMGRPTFDTLPEPDATAAPPARQSALTMLPRSHWRLATLMCIAGFFFTTSGAFMASWKPQILGMSGLDMTTVGIAGMFTAGAGMISHVAVGAIARRVGEVRIAIILLTATAIALVVFGLVPDGATVPLIAAVTVWGFCNVGSYTALILVNLSRYEVRLRNAGLGLSLGFSRVGGIVGPLVGGFVIGSGMARFWVLALFSAVMLVPVFALLLLRTPVGRVDSEPSRAAPEGSSAA